MLWVKNCKIRSDYQIKVLHFFKRINQIHYTFSNESLPLHDIFPSESNVCSTKTTVASDKYFWKSVENKVILNNLK